MNLTQAYWSEQGTEEILNTTALVSRPERHYDGESTHEEPGVESEVAVGFQFFEGQSILVFDADSDIRVGDIIRVST